MERTVLSPIGPLLIRQRGDAISELIPGSGGTPPHIVRIDEEQFYQTEITKCFNLPPTRNIWIDFDVSFDGVNFWRAGNVNDNGICGLVVDAASFNIFSNGANIQANDYSFMTETAVPVLLHMRTGAADGVIEVWINGEKLFEYAGDVNRGEDFDDIFLQCDSSGTLFSQLTFSSEELIPRRYDFAEKIYLNVLRGGQIILFPFTESETPKTPAVAIRYDERNWYNKIVAPSDSKAGRISIYCNGSEFRLSSS